MAVEPLRAPGPPARANPRIRRELSGGAAGLRTAPGYPGGAGPDIAAGAGRSASVDAELGARPAGAAAYGTARTARSVACLTPGPGLSHASVPEAMRLPVLIGTADS